MNFLHEEYENNETAGKFKFKSNLSISQLLSIKGGMGGIVVVYTYGCG